MKDYKTTLNLPKTNFSMRANLVEREIEILKKWNNNQELYKEINKSRIKKNIFILHEGPPYANGEIHIGHALNKILKDIIIKSKILSGYNSPYVPGWDCHGLPIELNVEKFMGKPNSKIEKLNFRKNCRRYVIKQIKQQRLDFMRLGVVGNWEHPYLTMDFSTEANIIRVLAEIVKRNYIFRGKKPVHWCIECRSSLAEAEVEYYNKKTESVYSLFQLLDTEYIIKKFKINKLNIPIYLIVWTTTLWTLPANQAVAINKNIKYILVRNNELVYIIADEIYKELKYKLNIDEFLIIGYIQGKYLEYLKVKHPFIDNKCIPIVLSDHVVTKTGTGIVHIAPGYGLEDYIIAKKYNLDIVVQIDEQGFYVNSLKELNGLNLYDAEKIILRFLKLRNTILYKEKIIHKYPFCWRHKKPTIFRATKQWFINIDKNGLRKKIISSVNNIHWIPKCYKKRITNMIITRPDWCISRQRAWGVPITLFLHKKTDCLHPKTNEIMKKIAKIIENNGIEAWWELDTRKILGEEAEYYYKVEDTLDVWFDSGSTHISVINNRKEFVEADLSDIYLEGLDQCRGWFMSSIIISTIIRNHAPCRQILIHNFVIDKIGNKMSKSTGNIVKPKEIVNKFGADILRLWIASSDYKNEIVISDKVIKQSIDSYRRIRNTMRFMVSNLYDFNPSTDLINIESMLMLDYFAIYRAYEVQKIIIKFYNKYEVHNVIKYIMKFCSVEMGSFYLDIIKDRQYTSKNNSVARRSSQTAIYHVLESLVRWIAPIISFTADEIWNFIPGKRSKYIFTEEWYNKINNVYNANIYKINYWKLLFNIKKEVNLIVEDLRYKKVLGSSLETEITLYASSKLYNILKNIKDELHFALISSKVKLLEYKYADNQSVFCKKIKELKIKVKKINGIKCARCWHFTNDIGVNKFYSDICNRCISNITGTGEIRKFI